MEIEISGNCKYKCHPAFIAYVARLEVKNSTRNKSGQVVVAILKMSRHINVCAKDWSN